MKFGKYIAIVAVLVSSVSLNVFAKDNETKVTLSEKVQIGSSELKPGDYKLQWDGTGPDVQVRFVKGKNVVATAPAKLLQSANKGFDGITTTADTDNKQLKQVDFAGGRQSLVFGEATPTQDASGQQ